ncbi:hypothetical protein ES702_03094 [subsurface metagenome]
MFTKEVIALALKVNEAIKKISKGKWEWEPEIGECFYGLSKVLHWIVNEKQCFSVTQYIEKRKLTPLLHWERIISILKSLGYLVGISINVAFTGSEIQIHRKSNQDHVNSRMILDEMYDSEPQLAVMRAVIELGKEAANEKD